MKKTLALFAVLFFLITPAWVWAKEAVVAVLSLDLAPYQEALNAFQQANPTTAPVIHLAIPGAHVEGEPQVIVAFGGKAVLSKLPDTSVLVYCMAPGTHLRPGDRSGAYVEISMMPAPPVTLTTLQHLQPGIKRLAVLWASETNQPYIEDLTRAAKQLGIEIQGARISDASGLPNRLRELQGQTDAVWIPSDPLMVTEANLILISQFGESTHIPYYSSISGLTKKGASASISISYRNIGKSAAFVTQDVLAGRSSPAKVYVQDVDVVVNPPLSSRETTGDSTGLSKDSKP